MNRCPKCNRVYKDDSQAYCLEDGGALVPEVQSATHDPQPTLVMPHELAQRPEPPPTIPSYQADLGHQRQMPKVNFGRVLIGGLVAGLVLNIGEFVLNAVILDKAMVEWAIRHNFPTEHAPSFMVVAIGRTFVLGIVMVWLYALIRPRMGPGPKTAIVAALVLWFAIYFYVGIIYGILLVQPLLGISIVWGLGEYVIAAIAGAWLYKEV